MASTMLAVGRVDEMLAVKLEVAYVGEARVVPRLLERVDEAIEVAEDAALAKVGDCNGGMAACAGARLVDAHERVDPSVEELELPELVILRESAIGLALYERLADHEVARHGTAAIGVELAELVAQVIFAQEEVEACHGQKVVIVAGQHDETMQIIGEVEELAVALVVKITPYDLAEDTVHRRDLLGDIGAVVCVEQIRHVGKWRGLAMNPHVGFVDERKRHFPSLDIPVKGTDVGDVLGAFLFHGSSISLPDLSSIPRRAASCKAKTTDGICLRVLSDGGPKFARMSLREPTTDIRRFC